MKNKFSLAHLTAIHCAPPELTYIASRAGYDYVSLRFIPLGTPGEPSYLPADKTLVRNTKAALAETGVKLLDLELARVLTDTEPKSYVPAMEVAAELGARHVISSAWTADRTDRNFLIERYSEICDLAKPFGLTVDLEFPSFSRLTNLQEAADIVRAANRPNGGIMVDTLYIYYSQVKLEELDALPREWFHMAHLCDAPAGIPETVDGKKQIAREGRLYAGEGVINIAEIFEHMPQVPYSIELPNAKRVQELGYEEHARRCLETAKQYFDAHARKQPLKASA